ncbi:MAG: hypothetical protein IJS28_06360 [Synergistaceae bacterium]|nr:hypothetical protein [Synergistaceae bacterium]
MKVRQISIPLVNKPGALHSVIETLNQSNVCIRAFTVDNVNGVNKLRGIADNVIWIAALLKEAGVDVTINEVLIVEARESECELFVVHELLRSAGITVCCAYPIMSSKSRLFGKIMSMVFEVDDIDRAVNLLQNKGFTLLSQEHISSL